VADFVKGNASFRAEISDLHSRVYLLESRPIHSSDFSSVIFRESTEFSKIEFNVFAYRVPESATTPLPLELVKTYLHLVILFKTYRYPFLPIQS